METYKNELPTTKTETMENTVLNDAFSVLANHIATSSEDALAANFIDSEKILKEYFTDQTLGLEEREDGSVAITKIDENGNKVIMGFTTKEASCAYQEKLTKKETSQEVEKTTKNVEKEVNKETSKIDIKTEQVKETIEQTKEKIEDMNGSKIEIPNSSSLEEQVKSILGEEQAEQLKKNVNPSLFQ